MLSCDWDNGLPAQEIPLQADGSDLVEEGDYRVYKMENEYTISQSYNMTCR